MQQSSSFFHIPALIQGGDVISLRQRLPNASIKQVLRNLEASGRKEIADFDGIPNPRCFPKLEVASPDKTQFNALTRPPAGFRIFLFQSDLEDIKKNWNHNFLAFTAVSLEKREVLYFVNNW